MNTMEFPSHRHPLYRIELLREKEEDEDEDVSPVGMGVQITQGYEKKEEEERRVCGLCGQEVTNGSAYGCSRCNFTAHLDCAENPPSLVIEKSKIHKHTLTLLPRQVSFTCNACGDPGDKSPYVCLKCCFMVHGDCTNFPRVIRISCHHHRISYTWSLLPGEWNCGVCRRKIDWKYGAYSCNKCDSYFVHLRCAMSRDVWDGEELSGEPKEEDEIGGFVGDEIIQHISHRQHLLRLVKEEDIRDVVCYGCSFPFTSDPFYRCQECDFFLHEECAKLPLRMTTFLHVHKLTLCTYDERSVGPNRLSRCNACDLHFNGFSYRCFKCDVEFDVRCSSIPPEKIQYHLHTHHPLVFKLFTNENEEAKFCNLCNHHGPKYMLSCIKCDFNLCLACATLPDEVIYKYDEHFLSHTMSKDVINPNWCDICEKKMDGQRHHYKCSDCGPVLHTECVLGSFRKMRPWVSFTSHEKEYQVVLNDRTLRYRCSQCLNDCNEPLLLMSSSSSSDVTIYLCSSPCFTGYVRV